MFGGLAKSVGSVLDKLRGTSALSEADINQAMREIRIALLEADVALPVAKSFIKSVKEKAVGQEVIKSVTAGQMVVKIVQDELTAMLGSEHEELNIAVKPPAVIMMVGLQGAGKTTTAGKIAHHLQTKQNKKVLMASVDIYRPAAKKQLALLGQQNKIDTVEIIDNEKPTKTIKRALKQADIGGYDVVFIDTAGRLHIDDEMMAEVREISSACNPDETLLVADALSGQDVVNVAQTFKDEVNLSGVVLTRVDGDSRGGAALSIKAITGCPIKFIGVGEKISQLDKFHPERIAQRILGMGDVVSLVEQAQDVIDKDEGEKIAKKMQKGKFDFNDMLKQFDAIGKMGGMGSIMNLLPGMGKIKAAIANNQDVAESAVGKQRAIIYSMTLKERADPKLLNASRKKRIAAGSGCSVQDINKLVKQHQQMQKMMKQMQGKGKLGMMKQAMQMMKGGNNPF